MVQKKFLFELSRFFAVSLHPFELLFNNYFFHLPFQRAAILRFGDDNTGNGYGIGGATCVIKIWYEFGYDRCRPHSPENGQAGGYPPNI